MNTFKFETKPEIPPTEKLEEHIPPTVEQISEENLLAKALKFFQGQESKHFLHENDILVFQAITHMNVLQTLNANYGFNFLEKSAILYEHLVNKEDLIKIIFNLNELIKIYNNVNKDQKRVLQGLNLPDSAHLNNLAKENLDFLTKSYFGSHEYPSLP